MDNFPDRFFTPESIQDLHLLSQEFYLLFKLLLLFNLLSHRLFEEQQIFIHFLSLLVALFVLLGVLFDYFLVVSNHSVKKFTLHVEVLDSMPNISYESNSCTHQVKTFNSFIYMRFGIL